MTRGLWGHGPHPALPGQERAVPRWMRGLRGAGTAQKSTVLPLARHRGTSLCHPTVPRLESWPPSLTPTICASRSAAPRPRTGAGHLLLCPSRCLRAPDQGSRLEKDDPSWHCSGDLLPHRRAMRLVPALRRPQHPDPDVPGPPSPCRPPHLGLGAPLAGRCGRERSPYSSPELVAAPAREASCAPCGEKTPPFGGPHRCGSSFKLPEVEPTRRREAPPHPGRHRRFKEGEILHINKRGPQERGEGGVCSRGGGGHGMVGLFPPHSPHLYPSSALVWERGFWVWGGAGERGEP